MNDEEFDRQVQAAIGSKKRWVHRISRPVLPISAGLFGAGLYLIRAKQEYDTGALLIMMGIGIALIGAVVLMALALAIGSAVKKIDYTDDL